MRPKTTPSWVLDTISNTIFDTVSIALVQAFRPVKQTDLAPSRPEGASASLAEAFGVGGKVRTTVNLETHSQLAWKGSSAVFDRR